MNPGGVFPCSVVLLFLLCQATCEDTYDIPVTINPLIQSPVEITTTAKLFYDMDKAFYSRVTVIDAASNAEQRVRDTIKKTINVVFLTVASSHVSRTLVKDDLIYKTRSNWSYTVDVNSILEASQGTLKSINHDTKIYKIQENAMKVLEKRFQFQSSEILTQLSLEPFDYYAVDEAKWINVVGIIVKKVIESRSKTLHLTSCYLGDMIGKTVARMEGFTLHEVDIYIYNTTMLLLKLPEYRDDVIKRLYQTFKMTPADLASISDTDEVTINNMILHDVLQLFTNTILKKLRVTTNEITEEDSSFDPEMLLSCNDKWNPFLAIIIPESFQNSAEAMAIEVETLSALINITYNEIEQFTITEMISLLEITIDPLSADKKLVEATLLSDVLKLHDLDELDQKNNNVFEVIHRFTNFTERQLSILYEWTSKDYLFSSMFFLEDVNKVCTIDPLNYGLLALARLTVGHVGDIACQSFNVLREIWQEKNVDFLEYKYSPEEQLLLDTPISMMVSQLTKAPSIINYRVLNTISETEELISKLSINNITAVTTYQSSYLKKLSFQDIIGIIVHLKQNGSFDRQVVSHNILTSLTPSLMFTSTQTTTTYSKFPTNTSQKSHTTTAELNTQYNSELTSTAHIPQHTTIQISNQINRTIALKRTTTISEIRLSQSPTTTKLLNSTVFVPISHSEILATTIFNNITRSQRLATPKYTSDDYSKSTIIPSYHLLTDHVNSATTTHPNSSSVSPMKNSLLAKSTVPLLITPSLPQSHFSNLDKLASINRTASKQHFIEYTITSTSRSSMISSRRDLNASKTVISQGYYQYNISSTRTARVITEQTATVSRSNIDSNVTTVNRSKELMPTTTLAKNVTSSSASKFLSRSKMSTFSPRFDSSYELTTTVLQTNNYSVTTSVYQSNIKTSLKFTQSLPTEIIILTMTKSRVPSLTPERKFTIHTSNMTSIVTSHDTISYTTSTKVMVNTTKSSLAIAGIDASSKGDFSSRANNSLAKSISLVIQTTRIKSTMLTSTKVTTTTIVTPKEITFPARIEPSSTMSVITTNTILSTEGLTTKKPSTKMNQLTSTLSTVDKPSLTRNSRTTSIIVPHIETSSPYLSTIPTPPISSQPTKVSTTLLSISMASTVKPNTTKLWASSSTIQKPGKVKIGQNYIRWLADKKILTFSHFCHASLIPSSTKIGHPSSAPPPPSRLKSYKMFG